MLESLHSFFSTK